VRRRFYSLLLLAGVIGIVVALPYALPTFGAWIVPGIVFRGDSTRRVLYLTIDDSPSVATPRILAILRKHQVRATFFIMSSRVGDRTQLTELVHEGHTLGHHMRTGQSGASLSFDTFKNDFESTERMLRDLADVTLYRPPSGTATAEQLRYVEGKGYTSILGSVFPFDHWFSNPRALASLCRYLAVPGGIVILHDGKNRGLVTAEVLDILIPTLKAKGYQFELLSPTWPNKSRPPTATAVTPLSDQGTARAVAVGED
jgi:peptidoglycan/xylan/chitin deacetylase (PgdA/CDA1 family)